MGRIGIIDWGIGGVSIYKLIKEQIGDIPVTYFSDTGVTPYGKMDRQELVSRLNAVIEFLKTQGVTHLVIGCNAASTAIPNLKDHHIPIEGVIDIAIAETIKLKPTRLGIIGGRRTVLSGIYRRAFMTRGIEVRQRVAQPLSGLIEGGDISSQKLRAECKKILSPLRNSSHILLACTHYPAIVSMLQKFVSPDTKFIDPAGAVVAKISRWKIAADGGDIFLTSGDRSLMKRSAGLAFGIDISRVLPVQI